MKSWSLFALAASVWTGAVAAQPTVADASWLAGRWVGEGLGGQIEETWSPGVGGQMVGHFQLVVGGKPQIYEFIMLDAQPNGLRMRVKHFNADFTAWEDKTGWHSFEPVSVAPNLLKFKGLTFARSGDELTISLMIKAKDGTITEHPLKLRRTPL